MNKKEFYTELENIMELDAGSITGNEVLSQLAEWNSLTIMVFIAMVNERFDITLSATKIADSKSVGDLISLLGDKITD